MRRIINFMTLSIGASEATITGARLPLGYQQILSATLAAATHLTVPTGPSGFPCGYAIIQCQGGDVRWRDDGTAPTASVGMTLASSCELCYVGDFRAIQFITSTFTPILDISYYAP